VATFKVEEGGGTAVVRRAPAPVAVPVARKGTAVVKAAPAKAPVAKPQSDDDGEWEEF